MPFIFWDKFKAETVLGGPGKGFEGKVTDRKRLQPRIPYPFKLFTSQSKRKIFADGQKVREHSYLNSLPENNV